MQIEHVLSYYFLIHSIGWIGLKTNAFVPAPSNQCRREIKGGSFHSSFPGPIVRTSTNQKMSFFEDGKSFIDGIIEGQNKKNDNTTLDTPSDKIVETKKQTGQMETIQSFIRNLASLSLEDYKWRSALFKTNEADRLMEESLARMRGENPSYLRPMDAAEDKIGPLGVAEKRAVGWLSDVIEEEGKRAKKIAEGEGRFIRPMDANDGDSDGPLAAIERKVVSFFKSIVDSETERAVSGKLRPMELEESKRGPLGEAELRAVLALGELTDSEKLRMEQSRKRGGDVVRPIDVPGPLGEIESLALEVIQAEKLRMKEREKQGRIVRPKDASMEGPLGKAEREAVKVLDRVRMEEQDRLKSIQRLMMERRPMENDKISLLGITEALLVGVLRAPTLLMSVADRVKELLQSENLPILKEASKTNEKKSENDEKTR